MHIIIGIEYIDNEAFKNCSSLASVTVNRTTLLNKYGTTGINQQATTNLGENELYVYLPENGYLEIVLPHATYTSVTVQQ